MIKVACPSCQAPYELDERRLPSGGLKMRCPKCGDSFGVKPDGSVGDLAPPAGRTPKKTALGVGPGAPPAPPPTPGKGKIAPPVPPAPSAAGRPAVPKPPVPKPAVPKPPQAKPPAPPAPKKPLAPPVPEAASAAAEDDDGGVDLPAVKQGGPSGGRKFATPFDEWEAELPEAKKDPSAGAFGGSDLPAVKKGGGTAGAFGSGTGGAADAYADLPAVKRPSPSPSDAGGIDLPVTRAQAPASPPAAEDDGLDLPAPKSRPGGDLGELDLPMPKARGGGAPARPAPSGGLDELDLPAPRSAGAMDADLPAPKSGADLPAPKGGSRGLDELDLPAPAGGADLPAPKGSLGELDLPMTKGQGDLPAPATDRADLPALAPDRVDLPARQGQGDLPAPKAAGGTVGDAQSLPPDLPGLDDDLPLPEPRARGGAAPAEAGAAAAEEDAGLEFDAIPEESGDAAGLGIDAQARRSLPSAPRKARGRAEAPAAKKPRTLRVAIITAGVLVVLAGAGFALGLTPYGYFGVYAVERYLPAAGDPAQVRAAIEKANALVASDTLADGRRALRVLADARRSAGLSRELLSRSLLAESLFEVRFGDAAGSSARAAAIDERLDKRSYDAPHATLARAAHALARGQLAEADALLGQAQADPLRPLVDGELRLAQGRVKQAAQAFEQAAKAGDGARASWGLARARRAAGDMDAAAEAAEATLKASPRHAAARVLLAERAFETGKSDRAEQLAREAAGVTAVDGERLRAAADTRAAAWTLLGALHEQQGKRGQAGVDYGRALDADPYRVGALLGLGQVLLAERKYDDALTRFRAARDAIDRADAPVSVPGEPAPEVAADVGAARALLALDRVQDARATMDELVAKHPDDPRVLLWVGKAAQAAGDTSTAEGRFREVMKKAPEQFAGYLALAQLFFEQDRPADAASVLESAKDNVPETAEVRRMLGESELKRGRLDAALREFRRALELDPDDTAALFGIGVAQRRATQLDAAAATFEKVAQADPSYPGLALERGRVYEARGQADRAVKSYRNALEEHPGDLDLMLRLGAALIASGQIDEAEGVLEKVMKERSKSAEGEYLLGRVELARDRTEQALAHFDRAVQLDGSRGEYHMYEARALLDEGSLSRAYESVQRALELDPNLGDAYWVRGQLRLRSGAVKDALDDFQKALELSPNRFEAYAGMGESYDQLGKRREAIAAYEKALEHDNARGEWWYRLGRLQLDAGDRGGAATSLGRATVLGDAMDVPPGWLADAHRLQADLLAAQRHRTEAVEHYRRYLELAPQGAIDRQEVQKKLLDLGAAP